MAVAGNNWCQYQYNPSEIYQNPGHGSHCGAETFQGFEDYEDVDSSGSEPKIVTKKRLREAFDPYCPAHGGTKNSREKTTASRSTASKDS